MNERERERFDALLEEAIAELPDGVRRLLDEVPVVVEDAPSRDLAESLLREWGEPTTSEEIDRLRDELCGLHTGLGLPERSVEDAPAVPEDIMLFRIGIIAAANGWDQPDADDAVYEEIAITLLHEIGHHFGLKEDDLERLGYA
ncbi:MAG: metallopeptidase family protein [Planctomycetota bacterium]